LPQVFRGVTLVLLSKYHLVRRKCLMHLTVGSTVEQCFSKWRNRSLGGDFEWQGGEKNKGNDRGGEITQRGRKWSTTNRSL